MYLSSSQSNPRGVRELLPQFGSGRADLRLGGTSCLHLKQVVSSMLALRAVPSFRVSSNLLQISPAAGKHLLCEEKGQNLLCPAVARITLSS